MNPKRIPARFPAFAAGAIAALAPFAAAAHPGGGAVHGLAAGLAHPLTGADHALALAALGLWAGLRGGRSLWLPAAACLAGIAAGGALAFAGVALPGVEPAILLSLLVLGLLAAFDSRVPAAGAAAIAAAFAVFHGHAHGAEAAAGAPPVLYAAGFLLSSAALLAAATGAGALARQHGRAWLPRAAAAGIAAVGAALAAGV